MLFVRVCGGVVLDDPEQRRVRSLHQSAQRRMMGT
jgi:hypothetical protein